MAVLQRKADSLEAETRDLKSTLAAKDRRIVGLEDEVRQEHETSSQFYRLQREHQADLDELRRVRLDNDGLLRKISTLESAVENATRDAVDAKSRDGEVNSLLQQKRSECSALKEKVANLESLKAISDKAVQQSQQREEELQQRLNDLRSAHATLQHMFDKQQEQLELGQRMRDQDLRAREADRRSSPASSKITMDF